MLRTMILALALTACGGKSATPAHPNDDPNWGRPMSDQGNHEEHMPPELAKFHDVLAPRWHADKGAQRVADTCKAIPDFKANADAIAKATPPRTAHADTWTTGTRALVDAVAGLEHVCSNPDQAVGFDEAFAKVHESFHKLLEASGAMHDEGGEHEHGA